MSASDMDTLRSDAVEHTRAESGNIRKTKIMTLKLNNKKSMLQTYSEA
jgi:hypothetical protein